MKTLSKSETSNRVRQCQALTLSNRPCKKVTIGRSKYCSVHQGTIMSKRRKRYAVEKLLKESELKVNPKLNGIFLLPRNAESLIVTTNPFLRISVVMPPQKQPVEVAYHQRTPDDMVAKITLDLPKLIWTQNFPYYHRECNTRENCICFICEFSDMFKIQTRTYGGNTSNFHVYKVDEEKSTNNKIVAAPYDIANIDDGFVCWGSMPYPTNLRMACSAFWAERLNNSIDRYYLKTNQGSPSLELNEELASKMKNFKIDEYSNINRSSYFLGQKFFSTKEKTKAIFMSIDPEVIKMANKFDNSYIVDCLKNKMIIGIANNIGDIMWRIKGPGFNLNLSKNSVTLA